MAVREALARKHGGIISPEQPPKGEHASNGVIEEAGKTVMSRPEITIHIDLARGDASDTVYTCDLSYDYVKINADYRS